MPYKTLLVVRENADRTRKNPTDSSYLSCYLVSWMWSQGPLPREERGTERLGLGLRLPSRDPGPDPLSCTPPPIGLCHSSCMWFTTKQNIKLSGWVGWSRNKKDLIPNQIFLSSLNHTKSFYQKPLLWLKVKWLFLQVVWKFLCEQIFTSHAENHWCQTAYAPGVDRERFSTRIYAVSARRATTRLIDSPTARGS